MIKKTKKSLQEEVRVLQKELEYIKEEYGIEDEETTKA